MAEEAKTADWTHKGHRIRFTGKKWAVIDRDGVKHFPESVGSLLTAKEWIDKRTPVWIDRS